MWTHWWRTRSDLIPSTYAQHPVLVTLSSACSFVDTRMNALYILGCTHWIQLLDERCIGIETRTGRLTNFKNIYVKQNSFDTQLIMRKDIFLPSICLMRRFPNRRLASSNTWAPKLKPNMYVCCGSKLCRWNCRSLSVSTLTMSSNWVTSPK